MLRHAVLRLSALAALTDAVGAAPRETHRSVYFWSSLDDGTAVPKGSIGYETSTLPRLCQHGAAWRKCLAGDAGPLLLLEQPSMRPLRGWQQLLAMDPEPSHGTHSYNHLPALHPLHGI